MLPGPRSPVAQGRVAWALVRAPATALADLHARYGDVVAFGVRPFRYVALFGPEANRFVLADHPEHFRWREALASLIPVDGDTALVVSDGEEHARRRRLVQPAFATRRIHGYLDVMVDEADRAIDEWVPGAVVDAFDALRRAIRRIAVRCLFGDALGDRADELGDALAVAIDFVNRPALLQVKVDVPWSAWHRTKAARRRADRIVNAEIARRRQAGGVAEPGDLLDDLLAAQDEEGGPALSDVELRDQVVSLIAAGYDTTSAAAGWAVHELLANEGAWEAAAREVAEVVGDVPLTVDHLAAMPHLDAVVHETLRLWPPGFVSGRKAADTFEFAGHRIPAGSFVLWSPYVTHRRADLWPEPDRFLPARWAAGEPVPYSFVPFGGGYRRCIGFAFALQELKVLLVQLLRRLEVVPVAVPVVPTGVAALHPRHGVPVRVVRNRGTEAPWRTGSQSASTTTSTRHSADGRTQSGAP